MSKELENIEEGTDINDLLINKNNRTVWIVHDNKKWKFVFSEISYFTQQKILSKLIKQNTKTGVMTMDTEVYYKELLKEVLRGAPPGFNMEEMSPEFGNKLFAELPKPGDFMSLDDPSKEELKNSNGVSETEATTP